GLMGKARRYWPFEGRAEAAETVCLGSNGGGNEPEIQWSPFFARRFSSKCDPIPSKVLSMTALATGIVRWSKVRGPALRALAQGPAVVARSPMPLRKFR